MSALVLRLPAASFRLPKRLIFVNLLLGLVLIALAARALLGGAYPLALSQVMVALSGEGSAIEQLIVVEYRLPRLLTAIGVGLAFGLAGEMIQTLLRNPLASPDIIGFSAGAGAGAIFAVVFLGGTAMILTGALVGGALAAAAVVALAWRRGIAPGQVVLIGIGVTLTLGVVSDLLMTRLDATSAATLMKWLVGSLHNRSYAEVQIIWLGLAVLLPLVLWHQFALGRSAMPEDVSHSLGVALNRSRMTTLALSVALVGLAVAAAGPLPFVAFVSGPIAHGLNRAPRPTVLTAGLVGAIITLLADAVSQSLPGGLSLPAGVFTALIGAPVLIWVLFLQARKQR